MELVVAVSQSQVLLIVLIYPNLLEIMLVLRSIVLRRVFLYFVRLNEFIDNAFILNVIVKVSLQTLRIISSRHKEYRFEVVGLAVCTDNFL